MRQTSAHLGAAVAQRGDQRGPVALGAAGAHVGATNSRRISPPPAGAWRAPRRRAPPAGRAGRRGSGPPRPARRRRLRRRRRRGSWRTGVASTTPEAPAALGGQRRPVQVEPPAEAQRRERQQLRRRRAGRTRSPGRSRRSASRAPASPGGRRVTRQAEWLRWRLRRLGQVELEAPRRAPTKRSRKRARQAHVVVDDEHPVEVAGRARRASTRLRFSNLPPPSRSATVCAAQRGVGRAGRAERERARRGAPSAARASASGSSEPGPVDARRRARAAAACARASASARRPCQRGAVERARRPARRRARLARRHGWVTSPASPDRKSAGRGASRSQRAQRLRPPGPPSARP